MPRAVHIVIVVLGAILVASLRVSGFELTPTAVIVVGENDEPGRFFWRPSAPINFDASGKISVSVSEGPPECTEYTAELLPHGTDAAENHAVSSCPSAVLISQDAGRSFVRAQLPGKVSYYFCGATGALRGAELLCPGRRVTDVPSRLEAQLTERIEEADAAAKKKGRPVPQRPQLPTPVVAYEELSFEFIDTIETSAAGDGTDAEAFGAALRQRSTGNYVTFDQSLFESPIESLRFGAASIHIPERQFRLRAVEVTLGNGTVLHVAFKSDDAGSHWEVASVLPIPFARHSAYMRMSDTRLLFIAGELGDTINQTTSLFLGTKWEKVEKAPFTLPVTSTVSRYFTTLATGIVPRPSLGFVALGTKKTSQKSLLLAGTHNELVAAAVTTDDGIAAQGSNFSDAFLAATGFSCLGPSAHNSDEAGCATSSITAVVQADNNGTVLIFYDQLRGGQGYQPPLKAGQHTVYAMRLYVNETEEKVDYEAKLAEEIRRKASEKETEELLAKARLEMKAKREQDKLKKRKQNKQRRQQWLKADEAYRETARKYQELDGQYIVVRPVVPGTEDLDKEMF